MSESVAAWVYKNLGTNQRITIGALAIALFTALESWSDPAMAALPTSARLGKVGLRCLPLLGFFSPGIGPASVKPDIPTPPPGAP